MEVRGMNKVVLGIVLLVASPLCAQSVKDYADVEGADSNDLTGIGVVVGLNGNGDSAKGESATRLRNLLQHFSTPEHVEQTLHAKNAALVIVTAELPAFAKKGERIDVRVSVVGDAKSLVGGELRGTDLRNFLGRGDPNLYAVANGRVVVRGDSRAGNSTAGTVPNGASVSKERPYEFIKDLTYVDVFDRRRVGKAFRLNLRRPDRTMASQLAQQINQTALVDRRGNEVVSLPVARTVDGGTVVVIVPSKEEYEHLRPPTEKGKTPYPGYYDDPVPWVDHILHLNVRPFASDKAVVLINDVTKAVSYSGDVKVKPGRVHLKSGTILKIDEETTLGEALKAWEAAVRGQDLIDAVRALDAAGLLLAEVRSQ